jgi:hypothetical protein
MNLIYFYNYYATDIEIYVLPLLLNRSVLFNIRGWANYSTLIMHLQLCVASGHMVFAVNIALWRCFLSSWAPWWFIPGGGESGFCNHGSEAYNHNISSRSYFQAVQDGQGEIFRSNYDFRVARGSVVGWGTMLQAGRSRVRFSMRSSHYSIELILPAALCPWGRLSL